MDSSRGQQHLEQTDQYNTFSEAFYVAAYGPRASGLTKSNPTDADAWNGSASTILSAIQRSYSWAPRASTTTHRLLRPGRHVIGITGHDDDASSDELIALGDVNATASKPRARSLSSNRP